MKLEEEPHFDPIELSDFADFLNCDLESIGIDEHYMQLAEEVVYLCINQDFIFDVNVIRNEIIRRFPRLQIPSLYPEQTKSILNVLAQKYHQEYKKNINKGLKGSGRTMDFFNTSICSKQKNTQLKQRKKNRRICSFFMAPDNEQVQNYELGKFCSLLLFIQRLIVIVEQFILRRV